MTQTNFFWFDYETFGTDAAWDRPCQFAGVRTDAELNVIGDPLILYCRQSSDYLPNPEACRVTGITPQHANNHGLREVDFIERIRQELAFPGTCAVGYNNIRFDDEFTRHTLFRNLCDPYEHEWKNNCSRWDLLDVVRLTRALRPEGIVWPINEHGGISNRLEHLSIANQIEHSQAHDAMSDVWATIGMAKLIKQTQPKLFEYTFSNRGKAAVSQLLNTRARKPCLQVSGMIPGRKHNISGILPIAQHPENRNSIIVLDLEYDSAYLADMEVEEISRRLYSPSDEPTGPDSARPGLRTVQTNKCPVLVPMSTLRDQDAKRLGIDIGNLTGHAEKTSAWLDETVLDKIKKAMTRVWPAPQITDVDGSLYRGAFLTEADKLRLQQIRSAQPTEIAGLCGYFDDKRLDEMAWRFLARNYPESLDEQQQTTWNEHCTARLQDDTAPWLSINRYNSLLDTLHSENDKDAELIRQLRDYGECIGRTLNG